MLQDLDIATICDQLPPKGQNLIAQSHFDILYKGNVFTKLKCLLYQNCIRFQIKNGSQVQIYSINFSFDVLFEMINEQTSNKKKWCLSACYSIRVQRFQKYIEFQNPQEKHHLSIWRDHLTTKLNQRGFHQQFCPIKELGQGFFANVYKIQRLENNSFYAVKAFNKEETYAAQKGLQAVMNQIQVMRSLDHPNLMKLYGVFQSKNSMYMCVQLLSGGQLWQKIKYSKKINTFELRKIMRSILLGLQAMHSKGYMHRDLKPENILLRQQDSLECVIADFGLVQNVNQTQHLFVRCGTPGYVAPEVLNSKRNKANYTLSCDMYSLGIILYLLLFKKSPFQGKTSDQVLAQNKLSKFNFDEAQYQSLNTSTLSLLKGLLQKEPSKRLTVKEALQHSFFQTQNQQILESFQPQVKGIKELKTNGTPGKEIKMREKKTSLQCESPLMASKNANGNNQRSSEQSKYQKYNSKDQVVTSQSPQPSPLLSKKVPKVKCASRFRGNKQNINS